MSEAKEREWTEKIEYAIRRFRSPFVDDPHLSHIKNMLEEYYLGGQVLATAYLNAQERIRFLEDLLKDRY